MRWFRLAVFVKEKQNEFVVFFYTFSVQYDMCRDFHILVRDTYQAGKERSFVKVRRYLAYSILIDSITYFMSAVFISMGESCFVLKRFIIPAAFYFQLYLMTFALIELMFSHEVTRRKYGSCLCRYSYCQCYI